MFWHNSAVTVDCFMLFQSTNAAEIIAILGTSLLHDSDQIITSGVYYRFILIQHKLSTANYIYSYKSETNYPTTGDHIAYMYMYPDINQHTVMLSYYLNNVQ